MLLTEYDEERTLKAEYYAGKKDGLQEGLEQGLERGLEQGLAQGLEQGRAEEQRNSLQTLIQSAAEGTISVAAAVKIAGAYGIVDEADLRRLAAAQGIQLPE